MKIKDIVDALEKFAPLPLQDGFDNSGLQVGTTEVEVTGALLCLDVTEEVIDEAISNNCNLIVSHHPLFFHPLKRLVGDDYVQRCVMKAVKNDIVLYASHTNMDNASGGMNYLIADKLGLTPLHPLVSAKNMLLKLVTFVPLAQADDVKNALFKAGCGCIGNYDSCSYNVEGDGTFRALDGTHPFCGEIGEHHVEREVRVETILPAYLKSKVTRALLESHPYEEPAFDFYTLANSWSQAGDGLLAEYEQPMDDIDFIKLVKNVFHVECVQYNVLSGKKIKKVALCGGAGASFIGDAIHCRADVFLTGEIKYHEFFGFEKQIMLMAIGHYQSEQYIGEVFKKIILGKAPHLNVVITEINTNPIKYF